MAQFDNLAISLTEAVSSYMKAKFHAKLQRSEDHIPFPLEWDFPLLNQCDQAVNILFEAYSNPCEWPTLWNKLKVETISRLDVTPWRAEDYASNLTPSATGQNLKVEAKLMKKFPPIFEPTRYMMKPCTILDEAGNFMLWYLPQSMTDNYSVSHFFWSFIVGARGLCGPRSVRNVAGYGLDGEILACR